jgi:hypothetical protein
MNFAFSALLIFLLLLPGAIFNYSYTSGWWKSNSPVSFQTTADLVAQSAISALVLNSIWSSLLTLLGAQFDWTALFRLLINVYGKDEAMFEETLQALTRYPANIALYLLSLYLIAALLGAGGYNLVRRLGLDWKWEFFRFKNKWYYVLTGEITLWQDTPTIYYEKPVGGGILVLLTAVVEHQNEDYLYRGTIVDFSLGKDGQPEQIWLDGVFRRKLCDDRSSGEPHHLIPKDDLRYYFIEGDLFSLNYVDIKTINLEYVLIEPEKAPRYETPTAQEPNPPTPSTASPVA